MLSHYFQLAVEVQVLALVGNPGKVLLIDVKWQWDFRLRRVGALLLLLTWPSGTL